MTVIINFNLAYSISMVLGEIDREQRRRRYVFVVLIAAIILIGLGAFVYGNPDVKYLIIASMVLLVEYVASAVFLRMKMNGFNKDAFKSEKSSIHN